MVQLKTINMPRQAYYDKTDGSFQQLIEHVHQNFPYIQIEEY